MEFQKTNENTCQKFIIQDMANISNTEMESIYAIGYNLYIQKKYQDAEAIFKFLCIMNHNNAKYWQAIAGIQAINKEYDNAINSYISAITNDLSNFILYVQCIDCMIKIKNFNAAYEMAKLALQSKNLNNKNWQTIFKQQINKINQLNINSNNHSKRLI